MKEVHYVHESAGIVVQSLCELYWAWNTSSKKDPYATSDKKKVTCERCRERLTSMF